MERKSQNRENIYHGPSTFSHLPKTEKRKKRSKVMDQRAHHLDECAAAHADVASREVLGDRRGRF
jgi:hypothetical protein